MAPGRLMSRRQGLCGCARQQNRPVLGRREGAAQDSVTQLRAAPNLKPMNCFFPGIFHFIVLDSRWLWWLNLLQATPWVREDCCKGKNLVGERVPRAGEKLKSWACFFQVAGQIAATGRNTVWFRKQAYGLDFFIACSKLVISNQFTMHPLRKKMYWSWCHMCVYIFITYILIVYIHSKTYAEQNKKGEPKMKNIFLFFLLFINNKESKVMLHYSQFSILWYTYSVSEFSLFWHFSCLANPSAAHNPTSETTTLDNWDNWIKTSP